MLFLVFLRDLFVLLTLLLYTLVQCEFMNSCSFDFDLYVDNSQIHTPKHSLHINVSNLSLQIPAVHFPLEEDHVPLFHCISFVSHSLISYRFLTGLPVCFLSHSPLAHFSTAGSSALAHKPLHCCFSSLKLQKYIFLLSMKIHLPDKLFNIHQNKGSRIFERLQRMYHNIFPLLIVEGMNS